MAGPLYWGMDGASLFRYGHAALGAHFPATAIIADFRFNGVAAGAVGIAQVIFYILLVLLVLGLILVRSLFK